jgi:DNA-binding transcriptional ArsR family regulator
VSQHLRVLRDAGLVEPERRGYFTHYHLAPGAATRCRAAIESLFKPRKGDGPCATGRRSARGRRT